METTNLTEQLIVAALEFRATKAWALMDDSNIFAVRLADGETGYCCVMGNAGEHHALGFYKGSHGFASYLRSLSVSDLDPIDQMELAATFDYVNCVFVNASDEELSAEWKQQIKDVAAGNGLKIGRPYGWPSIVRMKDGSFALGLDNDREVEDLTLALRAAAAVGRAVGQSGLAALGFEVDGDYPDEDGGKPIPLLVAREDGSWEWSSTETPELEEDEFPEPVFDDGQAISALKSIQHRGVYQMRAMHMPIPVGHMEASYLPMILVLIRKIDGFIMPLISNATGPSDGADLVEQLASKLIDSHICPMTIEVRDERTEALLADFCDKTGIRLASVRRTAMLDNALMELFMSLQRQ